jgi:hypothetical protein
MLRDDETKIARPRQIYTGERDRDYIPIDEREALTDKPIAETHLIDPS